MAISLDPLRYCLPSHCLLLPYQTKESVSEKAMGGRIKVHSDGDGASDLLWFHHLNADRRSGCHIVQFSDFCSYIFCFAVGDSR